MSSLTIAIVGKFQAQGIAASLIEIANIVTAAGHRIVIDQETAHLCELRDFPALSTDELGKHRIKALVVRVDSPGGSEERRVGKVYGLV